MRNEQTVQKMSGCRVSEMGHRVEVIGTWPDRAASSQTGTLLNQ